MIFWRLEKQLATQARRRLRYVWKTIKRAVISTGFVRGSVGFDSMRDFFTKRTRTLYVRNETEKLIHDNKNPGTELNSPFRFGTPMMSVQKIIYSAAWSTDVSRVCHDCEPFADRAGLGTIGFCNVSFFFFFSFITSKATHIRATEPRASGRRPRPTGETALKNVSWRALKVVTRTRSRGLVFHSRRCVHSFFTVFPNFLMANNNRSWFYEFAEKKTTFGSDIPPRHSHCRRRKT